MTTEELAQALLRALEARGLTLATAETAPAGGIGHALTAIPGSSKTYRGGVISYTNEVKHAVLGVPQETLDAYTAVSRETAEAMARGARQVLGADAALSVTGLAGPDGDGTGPAGGPGVYRLRHAPRRPGAGMALLRLPGPDSRQAVDTALKLALTAIL